MSEPSLANDRSSSDSSSYRAIRDLRVIALLEGISFLVLLGIAMPLKYGAGIPLAVTIAGWVHGALFVLYVAAVVRAGLLRRWPATRWIENLVASVVPAGPFFLEGRLKREQEELR